MKIRMHERFKMCYNPEFDSVLTKKVSQAA